MFYNLFFENLCVFLIIFIFLQHVFDLLSVVYLFQEKNRQKMNFWDYFAIFFDSKQNLLIKRESNTKLEF